jgi:signal transduction histidine kinase
VADVSGSPETLFGTMLDITERKRAESERIQLLAEQAARAEAEAARNRVAFLATASARLAVSLDYEQTLRTVAELTIPTLADACTVDVVGDTGALSRVAEATAEDVNTAELARAWTPPTSSEALSTLVRTGEATLYRKLADLADKVHADSLALLNAIGVRSMIIAPLPARGRVLGAITCFAFGTRTPYTEVERGLVQDVAQRAGLALDNARLHAEAQRATSLRDEFLSVAAHELKTPMTTLRGYTQLLARSTRAGHMPSVELLDRGLKTIELQSEKLKKLTEQLLDVSRLETGKLPINLTRVDLVELIHGIVQSVQQSTDRHTIEMRVPNSCVIEADPMRLEQVLANVIENGVKYSPDGGRVEVTLGEADPDHVQISIRDWGLGIPLDRRENLFDRFYQAHSEGHYGGLGLGLYVSREIVELHGGTIHAQFPTDGGSLFVIQLPRSHQPRM